MKKLSKIAFQFVFITLLSAFVYAQGYKKPPSEIMDILNAPETPVTSVSPAKNYIALLGAVRYPPVADLAEPMLRLAGKRVSPNTNSNHLERYYTSLAFQKTSQATSIPVKLPPNAKIISPNWSADGRYVAAGNVTPNGVELWIFETATGKATKLKGVQINNAFGGYDWMPDQKSLLVDLIPENRGNAPGINVVPTSPSILETSGRKAAIRTYQDLLGSPNDEKLFDYYATSQLAVVGVDGKIKNVNKPAIYDETTISPDGKYILASRIVRPYSYLFPYFSFPNEIEVWDTNGAMVYKVASVPIRDNLPEGGVQTGPRSVSWIPTEASTLMWAEALDGGDPKTEAKQRDKLVKYQVPTKMLPLEFLRTEQRYVGSTFGEKDGLMWFYDYDRDKQRRRIFMTDYRNPENVRLVSDLNVNDRYNSIGSPVTKTLANGKRVVVQNGDNIYLEDRGATANGDLPYLRRMNLKTLKTEEIWRSDKDSFEEFVALMDDNANAFITRRESISEPPNLMIRYADKSSSEPLTEFPDPSPQLRGITKKLIKYKRDDGVELSFTLYLPPNYKEGTKLPTLLWAYPLEYTNAGVAGQVSGSTNRFTQIGGYSHLFMLLEGYAILDNATVPIVGDPLTVNDTFIKQLVAGAKAAIDKGVEMGVVDPERVAVGGHSYGAFMTAHLLANSDLFRAGIARSGAYNRTLTPFGFQSERRSYWEAPESYYTLSPFSKADKIDEPLLMIHGEADNNSGTYPIQSERMFAAIQGNGGKARLVMLPFEAHGYAARESIEHVLWEQINWLDKYVKNAKPRAK